MEFEHSRAPIDVTVCTAYAFEQYKQVSDALWRVC